MITTHNFGKYGKFLHCKLDVSLAQEALEEAYKEIDNTHLRLHPWNIRSWKDYRKSLEEGHTLSLDEAKNKLYHLENGIFKHWYDDCVCVGRFLQFNSKLYSSNHSQYFDNKEVRSLFDSVWWYCDHYLDILLETQVVVEVLTKIKEDEKKKKRFVCQKYRKLLKKAYLGEYNEERQYHPLLGIL